MKLFLIYFFQYFYKYKKTRLSLQKGVFLRPSIRRIDSLTNCPFKRYSLNELFVF
ncbi:methyltransferase [Enterococcus faecalis]|nr:methyltransferase [Enterococcus faecalis]EGO8403322.1 methyltransferase [Enterococcus faecalis]EGO8409803.1 methyltransferase [Enterococcus faecalis]EGO8603657.1 methyltransferase [Enterococcus faecalis]EGO8756637.1 methyltransferase [Enterococcus faecalis]